MKNGTFISLFLIAILVMQPMYADIQVGQSDGYFKRLARGMCALVKGKQVRPEDKKAIWRMIREVFIVTALITGSVTYYILKKRESKRIKQEFEADQERQEQEYHEKQEREKWEKKDKESFESDCVAAVTISNVAMIDRLLKNRKFHFPNDLLDRAIYRIILANPYAEDEQKRTYTIFKMILQNATDKEKEVLIANVRQNNEDRLDSAIKAWDGLNFSAKVIEKVNMLKQIKQQLGLI